MYKAVFIDLDGTLLRKDHSISKATKETILKLVQHDILVVLVSARPYHGITRISEWLGIQALPVASLNGAYIVVNNKIIFESSISFQTVTAIHEAAKEFNVTLIYYAAMKWFAETSNAAIAKEQKITEIPITIAPFATLMKSWQDAGTGINKIMTVGTETVIAAFELKLLPIYKGELNIYTSKPTYLEIMHYDASKTKALQFLLQQAGIAREECIAIGDNFNDREMIEYAGTGVAMGNAPELVKAVADYVTDTNEKDGVRKALEKFIPL